ncbi:MAG: cytochrome c oxidase subunit 2A [Trueperaceae bacterium]|nr:cytochrome c oxidase subunit 2A [Trueperaceae bacterium]
MNERPAPEPSAAAPDEASPVEATPDAATPNDAPDATPSGAIAVTVFLAATILVFWFGMYFLNLAWSG